MLKMFLVPGAILLAVFALFDDDDTENTEAKGEGDDKELNPAPKKTIKPAKKLNKIEASV